MELEVGLGVDLRVELEVELGVGLGVQHFLGFHSFCFLSLFALVQVFLSGLSHFLVSFLLYLLLLSCLEVLWQIFHISVPSLGSLSENILVLHFQE